jgi:3-methyladenine DNA glycosylase AlkC
MPFNVLAAVARSPRWELKRRLAEALPALLKVDADRTVALMEVLRVDPPDPEWRTDIRRRVIEAIPSLWQIHAREAKSLLGWREGDEVYAALATLDALAEIGNPSLTTVVGKDLLSHVRDRDHSAIKLYSDILAKQASTPDKALSLIAVHWTDKDRLTRICIARSLHWLLPKRTAQTLKLMHTFLKKEGSHPIEHQNVRRALTRNPSGLITLLSSPYDESAIYILRTLAADQDIHIRRAVCDALPDILEQSAEVTLDLIEEYLLHDRDHFIHERTWTALRCLMKDGSERAEELCARLIEIA